MPDAATADQASPLFDWFARRGPLQRLMVAVLCGAAMTAGHPPISLPWIWFAAAPVLVAQVLTAPTGRAAAWIGWGAAFGYFVTGLHWMGHAFLVDPDRFAWLLPIGVTVLPSFFGLFWALGFWAAWRLRPAGPVTGTVALAGALTLVEFARSNILTGLPWALPAYVWVDLPPMQSVAWIGPFGLTLLTLMICALPALALTGRSRLTGVLALAAGAGLWALGALRIPDGVAYADDAPVLRVVQPNAPQHLKWALGHRERFYQRLLEATMRPADPALGAPDLVIWPEASVFLSPTNAAAEVVRLAAAAGDAWLLIGALHEEHSADGPQVTNALVSISPDGRMGPRYDKHHLVPFGEYMPYRPVFDALGLSQFGLRGDLARGPGPQTITVGDLPPFSPLICYEAIFPHQIIGATRPDWLVQPTNDAWFGSWAGPHQHYAQARIRAIEQGLPMVRAANTGISAVVDAFGREVVAIGLHRYDYFDARLPAAIAPTWYGRTGDWPAVTVAIMLLIGVKLARFRV